MNVFSLSVAAALSALSTAWSSASPPRQDTEDAPQRKQFGIFDWMKPGLRAPTVLDASSGGLLMIESDLDLVACRSFGSHFNVLRTLTPPDGDFLDPRGFACAGQTEFVADSGRHRIVRIDNKDNRSTVFGAYGEAPGQFRDPRGLAATSDALYVCDSGNHRVQKLAHDGRPLATVGGRGRGEGQFLRPLDVAVDPSGFVYVTDSGNHRVQKFDADLRFVQTWGDFGPHPGFFAFPDGIACFESELFVVDTDNHRVQVFGLDGAVRYEWGLHALLPREGEGKLHYPADIAIDPGIGRPLAWVSEPLEDRVQTFRLVGPEEEAPRNPPGTRVVAAHFGAHISSGGDLIALSEPTAPSLLLYDVEHDLPNWEPIQITRLATWGRSAGQLLTPNDVEVDWANKLLYVADIDAGTLSCWSFAHDRERPIGFDFFMLRFVRSVDLERLHQLALDDSPFAIRPDAIELAADGREIWVLDSLQRRIFALASDFSRCEHVPLELGSRPVDFAFANKGSSVLVVDELDADVRRFENPRAVRASVVSSSASKPVRSAVRFAGRGTDNGEFARPASIAVAPDGTTYVSDSALHRISKFAADGKWIAHFGTNGIGRVQFHRPRGLDVDESGRVWVVDWGNHRGQALSPTGEFLGAFGARSFIRPTIQRD